VSRHHSTKLLHRLRNEIDIREIVRTLEIPWKISEGYFRFLCPQCSEFNTATNPRTNLGRRFRCLRNFNPIDLVMAEKIEDGWRYLVVTTRPIKYNESDEDGGASLNYPFAVFTWEWTSFGSSDGTIYTKAALSIDPDGHIQVTQFDGDPGSLSDVRRIN